MLLLISSFDIEIEVHALNFLKAMITSSLQKPESSITAFPILSMLLRMCISNELVLEHLLDFIPN